MENKDPHWERELLEKSHCQPSLNKLVPVAGASLLKAYCLFTYSLFLVLQCIQNWVMTITVQKATITPLLLI